MIEELAKVAGAQGHQAQGAAAIPSTASGGASARRRRRAPSSPTRMKYAGKPAEQKIAELQAALRKEGEDAVILTLPDSIAWLLNIRGSDVAHNPVALAFAIVPASGKAELFIDPAKIGRGGQGAPAPSSPRSASRQALERAARRRSKARPSASASIRHGGELVLPQAQGRQGTHRARRPIPACCPRRARTPPRSRARAPPTSATARRWPASSPGSIARRRSGGLDEIAVSRQLETHPQRDAGAEGDQLRHHLRRRPERRHRALPRHHADQPQAQAGRALSGRLRRPVPRRHHRHHAHRRHRQADARDAGALHAGAEGPYRHRHGALSQGHARRRPRSRSRAARCGRRGSTSTTAPATASAAISPCTRGRRASPSAA